MATTTTFNHIDSIFLLRVRTDLDVLEERFTLPLCHFDSLVPSCLLIGSENWRLVGYYYGEEDCLGDWRLVGYFGSNRRGRKDSRLVGYDTTTEKTVFEIDSPSPQHRVQYKSCQQ